MCNATNLKPLTLSIRGVWVEVVESMRVYIEGKRESDSVTIILICLWEQSTGETREYELTSRQQEELTQFILQGGKNPLRDLETT